MTKMIVINTVGHFRIGFGLFFKASPGGRFSKDPVTYRARKAILETMIRLPWKAALLICFRYKERQNNCQVSKHETCSYWRYNEIFVTRKVSGLSRNGPLNGTPIRPNRCEYGAVLYHLSDQLETSDLESSW